MEAIKRKTLTISLLFLVLLENFHFIESLSRNSHTTSIKNCSNSDLMEIKETEKISQLQVNACNLTTWENGDFANYSNLSVLRITESQLGVLDDSTLDGLKRLKVVSFAKNNISVIGRWSREPLIALDTLDLHQNKIKFLQNNTFENYPNLQKLDLSDNLLETVNGNVFMLPYLKYLDLSHNHLTYINNTALRGVERLIELNLSNNEILEISDAAFESKPHLHTLELQSNKIENIQFLSTKSLKSLYALNLTKNHIGKLSPDCFGQLSHLNTLDLSWNLLTQLHNDSLRGLKSLEYLNISHNQMSTVASFSLGELGSLKDINLSHNNLSTIPAGLFQSTPFLQHINLAQNKLIIVSEMLFSQLPYLTNINVAGNKLTNATFVEHFAAALQVSELTLKLNNNRFEDATLNITKLVEFQRVELAQNHLRCLWIVNAMATLPKSVHFGQIHETVANNWSRDILNLTGIDCYDAHGNRSIIILQLPCSTCPTQQVKDQPSRNNCLGTTTLMPENPSPPPLTWPKIRVDKFDSRSVIIWMLIAIAIAFAGLRIARHMMDEKERKKLIRKLKHQQCGDSEMITLNRNAHKFREWTSRSYERLQRPET